MTMTPEEIRGAALGLSTEAASEVERLRVAEAEAVAENSAAIRHRAAAEERQQAAHYNLIAARGKLSAAIDQVSAHSALIELLNTDPTLIDDLSTLSWANGTTTLTVTPERMSALGCRGLIDRRHKPSPSVFSPRTPLTAGGWATLRLYRKIVGLPVDMFTPADDTNTTTPTEDR